MTAPRDIPGHMMNAFTLDGHIPVYDWYWNDVVPVVNIVEWSKEFLESQISFFSVENIRSGKPDTHGYGTTKLHLEVFEKYMDSIKNKKIAVIGSQTPWIESILVNCGAKEVTTVEYNVPICNHEIIKAISYTDFCKSTEQYDAIVSYSSIEHSGLGRYGDPLNPTGDIETMEQIYKSLVVGGLCIVGFPVGRDHLVWNAHRIYGPLRLKMMYLDKFKEIEWFGCDKDYIYRCHIPTENPPIVQPIIVLQK